MEESESEESDYDYLKPDPRSRARTRIYKGPHSETYLQHIYGSDSD